MIDANSVGIVERQYFTFGEPPNQMQLESGEKLGPITLAYETYGALNERKNNAILITHALSGDSHVAGYYSEDERKPGWWDYMIGPGKAIDTNKYFDICSNALAAMSGARSIEFQATADNALSRASVDSIPFASTKDFWSSCLEFIASSGVERLVRAIRCLDL